MHELAPLIKDLAVMLGIASIVVLLFQRIRQPVIFGYIVAGIIIGPYTPPYSLVSNFTQIETLSELGVIFLMFALGLGFSFHKLKRVGFSATIAGVFKVSIVTALGFLAGRLLQWSFYDSLFLGAALAISSTTIIVKALDELKLQGKRFVDVIFGILIVEDLLAVLMLAVLSTIVATKNIFSFDIFWVTIKLIVVVGCWFLSGYFIVPVLFRRIIRYVNQETLTIVSIALCLMLVVTAAYFHYSTALGAFIMGSILSETPLADRIKQLITPLRDVFAAIFFISIGMLIDIKILFSHWPLVLAISAFAIISKILITSIGTFLSGQSINTSIRVGFSMPPVGEFSFIIISLGLALNVISSLLYQIVIGTAAITILTTPFLIQLSSQISKKIESQLSERSKHFLVGYSAWIYRTVVSYQRQPIYRKFIVRLVINGIIVAVIFTLTRDFILPQITTLITPINVAEISSWVVALMFSSPFIWGMLFAFKSISPTSKTKQLPALFLGGLLTIIEIIILSIAYFHNWYIALVILIITTMLFSLFYQQLEKSYHWFELRLERTLRKKHQKQTQYEELAPWDTHLVEAIATNESPTTMVGKTLEECKLRQIFGINIVAIHRGSKVILAPRGNEKILLQDKLIVLGNDEQIDSFKNNIEDMFFEPKNENILKDFSLKAIMLESNNPLIGQTIRSSKIREQTCGLVVGLERHGFRILNPDPSTILKTHDLLLIVGKEETMKPALQSKT